MEIFFRCFIKCFRVAYADEHKNEVMIRPYSTRVSVNSVDITKTSKNNVIEYSHLVGRTTSKKAFTKPKTQSSIFSVFWGWLKSLLGSSKQEFVQAQDLGSKSTDSSKVSRQFKPSATEFAEEVNFRNEGNVVQQFEPGSIDVSVYEEQGYDVIEKFSEQPLVNPRKEAYQVLFKASNERMLRRIHKFLLEIDYKVEQEMIEFYNSKGNYLEPQMYLRHEGGHLHYELKAEVKVRMNKLLNYVRSNYFSYYRFVLDIDNKVYNEELITILVEKHCLRIQVLFHMLEYYVDYKISQAKCNFIPRELEDGYSNKMNIFKIRDEMLNPNIFIADPDLCSEISLINVNL